MASMTRFRVSLCTTALLLSLFCTSCLPSLGTFVTRDYLGQRVKGGTLYIAPYSPTVSYFGSVENEFGPGPQDALIEKHFGQTLIRALQYKCAFNFVAFAKNPAQGTFATQQLECEEFRGIQMNLPEPGTVVSFERDTPEYVLFMEDVSLGTYFAAEDFLDTTLRVASLGVSDCALLGASALMYSQFKYTPPVRVPTNPMFMQPRIRQKYLHYYCVFAFWDNRAGKVISFGRIKPSVVAGLVRMGDWEDIDRMFGDQITAQAPFKINP